MDIESLPYRPKVMICARKENHFLITANVSFPKDFWTFPGGGIEEGESPEDAALREFSEELGTTQISIVGQSNKIYRYDWPKDVIARHDHTYRGQAVTVFFAEFVGTELRMQEEEIREFKWITFAEFSKHFKFPHQKEFIVELATDFPEFFK